MSNAKLIAEARERAHMYTGGPEADRLWRLADALEEADRKIKLARAVFADSEEDEDVSNAMDIALA